MTKGERVTVEAGIAPPFSGKGEKMAKNAAVPKKKFKKEWLKGYLFILPNFIDVYKRQIHAKGHCQLRITSSGNSGGGRAVQKNDGIQAVL